MREAAIRFFRDETFGPRMGLFNLTHVIFLLSVLAVAVIGTLLLRKSLRARDIVLHCLIGLVMCLYFGDFLIHPLMNNQDALIVDKLPFHLCTSACLLISFCRIVRTRLPSIYFVPVVLGTVGALLYISYPTGVDGDYLLCYRTLQTMLYHTLLFLFGVFSLFGGDVKLSFEKFYKVPLFITVQILISLVANRVYSTADHHYDWYFTTGSSFDVNPYWMPFVIFGVLNLTAAVLFGLSYLVERAASRGGRPPRTPKAEEETPAPATVG